MKLEGWKFYIASIIITLIGIGILLAVKEIAGRLG